MFGQELVFELPVLSFILAQFGVLNSKFLQKYWRHAMILILIVAAVITPTPDPVNQSIFAIPLFLLYEVSVLIVKRVEKKKAKQASAQQAETQQEAVN
jgi:sec-independent protein translocase protein TatC